MAAQIESQYSGTYMTTVYDKQYAENEGTQQEPKMHYKNVSIRTIVDNKRVVGFSVYVDPCTDGNTYPESSMKNIHNRLTSMIENILSKSTNYPDGGM